MFDRKEPLPDCPNCGAQEGAFMGGSKYTHNVLACSDTCLQEIEDKIDANMSGKEYIKKARRFERIKSELREMKYRGVGTIDMGDDYF